MQHNKLKSGTKVGTEVTLWISSYVVGDSNDENNCPHKLLLTTIQASRLCKAFANNSLANIELSNTQLNKIRGFLGRFLGPLLKIGSSLIENLLKPLAIKVF